MAAAAAQSAAATAAAFAFLPAALADTVAVVVADSFASAPVQHTICSAADNSSAVAVVAVNNNLVADTAALVHSIDSCCHCRRCRLKATDADRQQVLTDTVAVVLRTLVLLL